MDSTGAVVVGLDESPSAEAALRWAADYARAQGARLLAIHISTHLSDLPPYLTPGLYVPDLPDVEEYRQQVRRVFHSINPRQDWVLEQDHAGPIGVTLVDQSRLAKVLVIGTREHVGLGRILNGSVSHYCLSHADCPVVAVPAPRTHEADKQAEPDTVEVGQP